MIGEPIPHPRDIIVTDLEKYKNQFFAAGKIVQAIPIGLSGLDPSHIITTQQKQLQSERAKLAPAMRAHAAAGSSLMATSRAMKLRWQRVKLIAKENGIVFSS